MNKEKKLSAQDLGSPYPNLNFNIMTFKEFIDTIDDDHESNL